MLMPDHDPSGFFMEKGGDSSVPTMSVLRAIVVSASAAGMGAAIEDADTIRRRANTYNGLTAVCLEVRCLSSVYHLGSFQSIHDPHGKAIHYRPDVADGASQPNGNLPQTNS